MTLTFLTTLAGTALRLALPPLGPYALAAATGCLLALLCLDISEAKATECPAQERADRQASGRQRAERFGQVVESGVLHGNLLAHVT
jgi:hypothetical protein